MATPKATIIPTMIACLRKIKEALTVVGKKVSTVVNTILLGVIYIFVVGPLAIAARLMKKRFIQTEKKSETYWVKTDVGNKPVNRYYRQY